MHGQLEHLADMTSRASVTVQVVPASLGAHAGMLGAFILADPSGTLYLERSKPRSPAGPRSPDGQR